jgi:hypothetical protein
MVNKMNNLKMMCTAIVSFFIAYSIMVGWAQEVVHFAGPLNEIFCTILAGTMGIMCLFALDWKGLVKWVLS